MQKIATNQKGEKDMSEEAEFILEQASSELDNFIKQFPPAFAELFREHQESFIMGFILGFTDNNIKYCKENFPQFDWDSDIAKKIRAFGKAYRKTIED